MVNYTEKENGEMVEEVAQSHVPIFFANASTNSKFLQSNQARPLIFDLHGIWCDVQRQTAINGGQLSMEDALELSRAYRKAINAIKPSLGPSNNAVINEVCNSEILWALTEEIYMKPECIPLVLNLISWGNNCFNETNKLINERLADTSAMPEEHEFYWNSLILSIFRVNLSSAVRLLRKHSRFEKDGAIQQICFLLESFQTFLEQGLPNSNAFLDVQRKVRDMLQSGSFKRSEQLTIIAGLLIGKNDSYEKCARMLFDNWYELLPAYALFTCPGATIDNIGRISQTLYNTLCPSGVHVSVIESLVSDIDRPIFSILCRNLVDMFKQVCEKSNLWWFPVHFIDLFYRFNPALIISLSESFPALKRQQNSQSQATRRDENNQPMIIEEHNFFSVRSAMAVDYGRTLMGSQNYWIIASDYLNTVTAEELGSEPNYYTQLNSVRKAEFIYAQAVKYEQKATQSKVCQWFVKKYVSQGCLSEALCWALRSNLPELINSVSNKLLSVASAETISTMRIFDGMAEQFYTYPSLLLLQRFYEFRRSLSQGQVSEAVSRIQELITSGVAPIDFQLVLFDQMTKLLDSGDFIQTPQLDRNSVYDLMKAINKFQIQESIINPPQLQKENPATLELNTKIKFFRQALCNSLASRSLS